MQRTKTAGVAYLRKVHCMVTKGALFPVQIVLQSTLIVQLIVARKRSALPSTAPISECCIFKCNTINHIDVGLSRCFYDGEPLQYAEAHMLGLIRSA